jgi:sporulation protein YhbH
MSIFKEHKTIADRSASDRRRHKQKIEKAIREGIHNIVADESIIGENGKKKFRLPVKGIKEYRFVYGNDNNTKNVGSAPGKDIKRGQKIGDADQQSAGPPNKASNEKGEEYYDVEITLEELAQYLFDELELPELQRRQLTNIFSDKLKRKGYRPEGIQPRLDRKKSAIARIKRMKAAGFNPETAAEGETFPFHEEDLKYRHYKITKKPCTNAVIFFVMDVSGSMTQDKKFLARSFCFLLYHFIRAKYETVEIVFVTHDTEAREVDEQAFFTQGTYGGTIASSGIKLVNEIIEKRFHPASWNIYAFQCSDGDNYDYDTNDYINETEKLRLQSQLLGYCEIDPDSGYLAGPGRLYSILQPLQTNNLVAVRITKKEDIWPAFREILGAASSSEDNDQW